jgi:hypothetical protein
MTYKLVAEEIESDAIIVLPRETAPQLVPVKSDRLIQIPTRNGKMENPICWA